MPIRTDNTDLNELIKMTMRLIDLLIFKKLSKYISNRVKIKLINNDLNVSIIIPTDIRQSHIEIIKNFTMHMLPYTVKYPDNRSIELIIDLSDATIDKLSEMNNIIDWGVIYDTF